MFPDEIESQPAGPGPALSFPLPSKYDMPQKVKCETDQWPSLQSMNHPVRREKWLRETDAFFGSQAKVFLEHQADVPTVEAMLADLKDRLAALERQVEKSTAAQPMSDEDRTAGLLLRWETLTCGIEALDAVCWASPWAKPAHGAYENYTELRTLAISVRASRDISYDDIMRASDYQSHEPPYITNAYRIMQAETQWLNHHYLISKAGGRPAVPVKHFFQLAKRLGIPTELQVEMATAEKPTGGSYFVW
ncbi:hypothetical protein FB451DRAFT_705026 [Mycena latifolia]|nr:hypothetical protein FB451DRAFT_705026 [Mycena latifolia]